METEKFLKSEGGFTLVELMVVVLIIALLLAVAIPFYSTVKQDAREVAFDAQVRELRQAAEIYVQHDGSDVEWVAQAGWKAGEIMAPHETWMLYLSEWPANPLKSGDFAVKIEGGEITITPEREDRGE